MRVVRSGLSGLFAFTTLLMWGCGGNGGTTEPQPTGTVSGTVTEEGGGPALAGRTVVLRRTGTSTTQQATTNATGVYTFTNVAVGNYTVEVTLRCGEPGQSGPIAITVTEGQTTDADLEVTPRPAEPLLSCDVQPILQGSCALGGCHGATKTPTIPDMDFQTAALTHETTVSVPSRQVSLNRVEPGEPDQTQSYLVCKIEATCAGRDGDRMPQTGAALTAQEIQTIKDWIAAGALEN